MSRTPSKSNVKSKQKPSYNNINSGGESYWLYGRHSCEAALANPRRKISKIMATRNAADKLRDKLDALVDKVEIVDDRKISHSLTPDAVHQGIALQVEPLNDGNVDYAALAASTNLVVLLDEVTDPHNIGAIMRSASAFSAGAVLTTFRNSPPEGGVLAKSASGALEWVRYLRIRNLVKSIEELRLEGFRIVGLAGDAETRIDAAFSGEKNKPEKIAIVMGAEGKGIRQVTADACDILANIPMDSRQESLNVSNATAIALWEASKLLK
jgi:23S rRNA (guanosine2251-2'-O)-methyltransferase